MNACTCGPGGRPPDPHPDLNVCRHLGCDPACPTCPGDDPTMTRTATPAAAAHLTTRRPETT